MADVESWACQACTFLNCALLKRCEICETPRGKDGSASPFYPAPAAARIWSTPSPSSPSFLSSSTSRSPDALSSSSSRVIDAAQRDEGALDDVGQRLDICRKRDYRFLSLETISLSDLPAPLATALTELPLVADGGNNDDDDNVAKPSDGATDTKTEEGVLSTSSSSSVSTLPPQPSLSLSPVLDGARLASQLTTLFLNGNAFESFPVALARLGQLRELHMHYNRLTTLPPCIGDFAHLEKLFLSHNALVALPPEIGRLTSLQTLSLFNNHLTSLPPQLGQLRSLHSLFLNDNALTALPPQMFDRLGSTLAVLQLNSNRLSSLPPQIGRLSALRKLNIEGNALVTVPASMALLGDLSVLAFRRNLFHYAVPGTWNVGPPTLLHLACAAVRRHIHQLSHSPAPPSSSSSLPTQTLPSSPVEDVSGSSSSSSSMPSPSLAPSPPPATSPITAFYEGGPRTRGELADDDTNGRHRDESSKVCELTADSGSIGDMVQELNITEELKKLLLEGEGGCSVCGKLMYGDGYVVRVFPMELLPSLSGSGMCLSVVNPASASAAGAIGNQQNSLPPATAPAPTPILPSSVTARPKVVVRGTYCSWLCAKRQVPLAGHCCNRPDRACAAPPLLPTTTTTTTTAPTATGDSGDGAMVGRTLVTSAVPAPAPMVVLPLPLVHRAVPPSPASASPATQEPN